MILNKTYTLGVSEPWNFTSLEGDNIFTAQLIDKTTDKKNKEYFLLKINIPFNIKKLIRDEIVKDNTLKTGKYRRVEEYEDLKVEYIVATYRHKEYDHTDFNVAYISANLISKFKDIDGIYDKLKPIMLISVKESKCKNSYPHY